MKIMSKDELHSATQRMIIENNKRYATIFGKCDQFTGKGIERHIHYFECIDFDGLPWQYLTPEVFNAPIYQEIRKHKSINAYIRSHPDKSYKDVYDELLYTRLCNDPSFAFYVCFPIKYKKGGRGPFILNYAQRVVLLALEEMRLAFVPIRIILLKARQWGGSTLVQLYIAWMQLFLVEQWNSVIVAQTKDTSKRIKAMYTKILSDMPGVLFGTDALKFSPYEGASADSIITNKKGEPIRDNVITTASYENFEATRGMDYAMAHLSEVAYWKDTPSKNADDVITNLMSNILTLPNTLVVQESTARGNSGLFYTAYQDAKIGKTNDKSIFIPFFYIEHDAIMFKNYQEKFRFATWLIQNADNKHAENSRCESGEYLYGLWVKGATLEHINWYVQRRKDFTDHSQMAREAPSDDVECFTFSGNKVFSIKVVEDMRSKYAKDPINRCDVVEVEGKPRFSEKDNTGNLFVWSYPITNINVKHRYLVIVDVGGRSSSSDYNVITVIDRFAKIFGGACEVVARWRGHIRYDYLARKAVSIARLYNNALLAFESNTFDKKKAEANEFVEQGDHIRGILDIVRSEYKNLYMRKATSQEDIEQGILQKVGFQTNVRTKQDMVDLFTVLFEDDKFIDHDIRLYQEAAIYEQREDGSYGNIKGKGNHDDIIMTDMIGALIESKMPMPKVVKETKEYNDFYTFTERTESDIL